MSSTYLSLHYHLVFSTKGREPVIAMAWRRNLHKYLAGTVAGLEAHCEIVGGTADHVHLLVELRATHRLSDFMRELKRVSSTWVHSDRAKPEFAWQEGHVPAAVLVGAVLEKALRKMCDSQQPPILKSKPNGEPKTLNPLIDELKASGVYK
jgi:REP element-mobilizing transposase RayT